MHYGNAKMANINAATESSTRDSMTQRPFPAVILVQ